MTKKDKSAYKKSVANLKLEGFDMTLSQHKMVIGYQNGITDRAAFLTQVREYARTR